MYLTAYRLYEVKLLMITVYINYMVNAYIVTHNVHLRCFRPVHFT